MNHRANAAALVAGLFEDGGRAVLAEGGAGLTWEDALAPMPDGLFEVDSDTPGVAILSLARDLWNRSGNLRMATAVTRGLLGWHVANQGQQHPDTFVELGALGYLAQRAGREAEGAAMLEEAWAGLRSVVGGRDLRLAVVAGNLGLHYARSGDLEQGEHVLEQAYRIRKRAAPLTVANVAGQLGEVRLRLGRVEDALECLRDAWMAELDQFGENHPRTVQRARQLAIVLNQAEKYRESVAMWRGLDAIATASGQKEPMAEIGFGLGVALYHTHKREEAIRRVNQAVALTRELGGDTPHPELPERLTFLAQVHIDLRRPLEAEGLLTEAVERQTRISGPSSPEVARRYVRLAVLIAQLGRVDEAMGYMDGASSLLRSTLGDAHPHTQTAVEGTVDLLMQKAKQMADVEERKEATALLQHARSLGGQVLGFDHPSLLALQKLAMDLRLRM
ncbi:MAG: tetratricopeptide repeat protein [Myxococcota bacterium]